jgi:hypothetical protein
LLARRGANVTLECLPPLRRWFESLPGVTTLISVEEALPDYDVHVPLLSLPRHFRTSLGTIPAKVPYLHVPQALERTWLQRLSGYPGLKVGLCWQGSPTNVHDAKRSIALGLLAPLAAVPGVRLFSLQKRQPGSEPPSPPAGMDLVDLEPWLTDFAETAAAIACLDLVISVDTAVAHAAGGLGRPVWVLLPHVPDWRWLLQRDDSPWYPSARLFRQSRPGDWTRPVHAAAEAMAALAAECAYTIRSPRRAIRAARER